MKLFGAIFGNTSPEVKGEIAYYNLVDWWLNDLNQDERDLILEVYQPLGGSSDNLIKGDYTEISASRVAFLTVLSGWFNNKVNRPLAKKILERAAAGLESSKTLDRHFYYQAVAETYYQDRDDPKCLEAALDACRKQIAISTEAKKAFIKDIYCVPAHHGFNQLAIYLEKERRYDDAIALCKQAKAQGWNGDWDKRIERCQLKKSRSKS